jgi:hypothetical protein
VYPDAARRKLLSRLITGASVDPTRVDAFLWSLGIAVELSLFLMLVSRRFYREFPVFVAYLLYSAISDTLFFLVFRYRSPTVYFRLYFTNLVPEFLFQIGILLEVAHNVVAPVKRSLPKSALLVFTAMLLSGTVLTLLLSIHSSSTKFTTLGQHFIQLNFAVAVLRLVIFSAIALFSQMLGIGWKNHVLQIATGFASYSVVILLVELLRHYSKEEYDAHFRLLDEFRVVGWCLALGYWSYVLAKKEAARKEFDPKMANFLVFLAQATRNDRAAAARWYRK